MRLVLFLIFSFGLFGQLHISVFDSETKKPISEFTYQVDSGKVYIVESNTFSLNSQKHIRIKHVAYEGLSVIINQTTSLYLIPKIFQSNVDIISSKIRKDPTIESIDLTEEKNAVSVTIDKLIEELPSVYITDYGGGGAAKTLRIRGSSDRHSLVLYDGISVNTMQNAWSRLGIVPLANASGINLFTSGNSGVFGPNALSGALNISFIPKFTERFSIQFSQAIVSFERNRKEYSKEIESIQFLNLKKAEIDGLESSLKLNFPVSIADQTS